MSAPDSTARIARFIGDIGLVLRWEPIAVPTAMDGVLIDRGELVVDVAKLLAPGDVLHEAGHLAIIPSTERPAITGPAGADGGYEMAAIAWSYAAACHLGLDARVVFHEAGYRGASASLIENFSAGRFIGVPMLEWLGLTADKRKADELGVEPYPKMIRWVVA
jgi:hypothetical protein